MHDTGRSPLSGLPDPMTRRRVDEEEAEIAEVLLEEADIHIEAIEESLLSIDTRSDTSGPVDRLFRAFHTVKGGAAALGMAPITDLSHAAEAVLSEVRKSGVWSPSITSLLLRAVDALRGLCNAQRSALGARDLLLVPTDAMRPLLEELTQALNKMTATLQAGELPVPEAPAEPTETKEQAPRPAEEPAADEIGPRNPGSVTIRVSMERVDTLLNLVGELVTATSSLRKAFADDPDAWRMREVSGLTDSLRQLVIDMRMIPLHGVFQRMARAVRGAGEKLGKRVELVTEGDDAELDTTVIDTLVDPMLHIVRNSVDHGLETEEERLAAGKPPVGRVWIKAAHDAGAITIEIGDDGRGLDRKKLRAKGIERGVLPPNVDESDPRVLDVIFAPGLSTSETVSDISGRGVGMDVVRRNVERIGGTVETHSVQGRGTRIVLRLPLTLAIIDGVLVRCSDCLYVIPAVRVNEITDVDRLKIRALNDGSRVALVRGRNVGVVDLADVFGRPRGSSGVALTVFDSGTTACVVVDQIIGQEQVVVKPLGGHLRGLRGIAAGTVLGDGSIALIVDVSAVLDLAQARGPRLKEAS